MAEYTLILIIYLELIDLCKKEGISNVYYHVFLDGRDTLPNICLKYLDELSEKIKETSVGSIASISGRYYAMDRDNRWERIKKAYNAIVYESGNIFPNFKVCFNEHYKREITDEFINPSIITSGCTIHENDAVLFMNFRPERMTEIIDALTNKSFKNV